VGVTSFVDTPILPGHRVSSVQPWTEQQLNCITVDRVITHTVDFICTVRGRSELAIILTSNFKII
jgi:hypothetical protein